MSIDNLISVQFTEEEKTEMAHCITRLEEIMKGKVINLTPEERQQYGRIGEKSEYWIQRVEQWMQHKPEVIPYYLDVDEFKKDMDLRNLLKPLLDRISLLTESMDDTALLLSTDIYNMALAYYRNIKIVSRANVPGTTEIYQDLSTKFPGRPSVVPEESSAEENFN